MADDDAPVARSVARIIQRRYVVHVATSAQQIVLAVARYQITVLLLDLMWGSHTAFPGLKRLIASHPGLRVCMHSAYSASSLVTEAFRLGACGYLVKPATADELYAAVLAAASGRIFLDPGLSVRADLLPAIRAGKRGRESLAVMERGCDAYRCACAWLAFDFGCTPSQSIVLYDLSTGWSKKQIAGRSSRGVSTIASHALQLHNLLRELGVHNAASLGAIVKESLTRMPPDWGPPFYTEVG